MLSDHIGEIINESNRIVGDIIHDKHEAFIKVIKKMIIAEYSTKVLKQNGINAKNLTDTIYFAYKGVTIISEDQTAYQKNLKKAINTILKPIKA